MQREAVIGGARLVWRIEFVVVAILAAAAAVASLRIDEGALGPLLRFASVAVLGWIAVAGVITLSCGLGALELGLPDVLPDMHALSRFPVALSIANGGWRWPALFVTLHLETASGGHPLPSPPVFLGRLGPGETTRRAWLVTIRARGPFEIGGVQASALFPGSPFQAVGAAPLSRRLLVLPAVYRLDRKALALLQGRRLATGRLHQVPAANEDFLGVRLYRPGDNPRHIHRALSMRLQDYPLQLAMREFEDPSADDVVVLLDNSPPPGEADVGFLYQREKAISFTVALCRLLCEEKYRVRFATLDEMGRAFTLPIERPSSDLRRLEARLARFDPAPSGTSLIGLVRQQARASNAAILVVGLDERRLERVHPELPAITITPLMQRALTREVSAA